MKYRTDNLHLTTSISWLCRFESMWWFTKSWTCEFVFSLQMFAWPTFLDKKFKKLNVGKCISPEVQWIPRNEVTIFFALLTCCKLRFIISIKVNILLSATNTYKKDPGLNLPHLEMQCYNIYVNNLSILYSTCILLLLPLTAY